MTAAIRGERVEIVKRLCSYKFMNKDENNMFADLVENIEAIFKNKDVDGDNFLHHSYMCDIPVIR